MIGYELLSRELSGQINLMQDDLDATTMAVLDRLLALGGYPPGVDGKVTIKRYCNLAEPRKDPFFDSEKDKEKKEWIRKHFSDPMSTVIGGRPYILTPLSKEEPEEEKEGKE